VTQYHPLSHNGRKDEVHSHTIFYADLAHPNSMCQLVSILTMISILGEQKAKSGGKTRRLLTKLSNDQ